MNKQMTDLAEIIISRRTIHDFIADKFPDKKIIKDAIETSRWAPNHQLTEPWHFYLLGKETISSLCELNMGLLTESKGIEVAEKKIKRWQSIPGWLVVTCERSDDELMFQENYAACCCVIQNLMLSLWEKGIGTKWSTGPVTREDQFYDTIWVNKKLESVVGLIWYGYPAEIPQTMRKPLQQVLTELP
jgi:nitroreductase